MELLPHKIEVQLQEQFIPIWSKEKCYTEQLAVCRLFHPFSNYQVYLISQDPEDPDYLWGIANVFSVEYGSFSLSDLKSIRLKGLPMERDLHFESIQASELFKVLKAENPY
jgi:hypothetical protein